MKAGIVHSEGGVTLLGGGWVSPADLAQALTLAPCLVAADGGADRALDLGLAPEAVIGDMDSLSARGHAAFAGRLYPMAEQDSTDFGKCLSHVQAGFYLGLGFTGLRLDHSLAALNELARRPAQRIVLLAEEEVIFRAPPHLHLHLPPGSRLSLYPMGAAQGRSAGLRWPIEGIAFCPEGRIGTSNEVTGPVTLDISGPMLVLLPKAQLGAALAALCAPPLVPGE